MTIKHLLASSILDFHYLNLYRRHNTILTFFWQFCISSVLCPVFGLPSDIHRYNICQWTAAVRWFSPGTPVSSTNKTDRHDITEILLKMALKTIGIHLVSYLFLAFLHLVLVNSGSCIEVCCYVRQTVPLLETVFYRCHSWSRLSDNSCRELFVSSRPSEW
jgi:hypothetical protein